MSKAKVLELMEQHPEWKGDDGSLVRAARKASKEFARKHKEPTAFTFDSLPLLGEGVRTFVTFDKSGAVNKIYCQREHDFSRGSMRYNEQLFDRLRDSLTNTFASEGEAESLDDGSRFVQWKFGAAKHVISYDKGRMAFEYLATLDGRKKK